MKINLGCGRDIRLGYVNIDSDTSIQGVNHLDLRKFPEMYPKMSQDPITEVLLINVLRCLTPGEFAKLLVDLQPLLAADGRVVIKDTDYTLLADHIMLNNLSIQEVNNILYGTGYRGVFNRSNVIAHANSIGMYEDEAYYSGYEFGVILRKHNGN